MKKIRKYILSIFVFTIVLELCARIDDWIKYEAPLLEYYSSDILRGKDKEYLNINIPNIRFEKWKNNNYGFRGPNISLMKGNNIIRLFCIGSSESYGLYESIDMEWPAQLRQQYASQNNLEIINASVVAMRLNNVKKYFEKYIIKFDPDIVILIINPFQSLGYIEKLQKNNIQRKSEILTRQINKNTGLDVDKYLSYLRILPKIKQVLINIMPSDLVRNYEKWKVINLIENVGAQKTFNENKLKNEIPDDYENIFKSEIIDIIKYFKQSDIEVILTTYPSLWSSDNIINYYDILLRSRIYLYEYSMQGLLDISTKFNNAIRDVAINEDIHFIDLESCLPKNMKYFSDSAHYTDLGAQVIATQIKNYLNNEIFHNKKHYE